MKIINYEGGEDFNDIQTLTITIKAIPFDGYFVPAFLISSPEDDYSIKLDEMHCLMDGIEIAQRKVDDIINFILKTKVFNNQEDEEDDNGETD